MSACVVGVPALAKLPLQSSTTTLTMTTFDSSSLIPSPEVKECLKGSVSVSNTFSQLELHSPISLSSQPGPNRPSMLVSCIDWAGPGLQESRKGSSSVAGKQILADKFGFTYPIFFIEDQIYLKDLFTRAI